MSIHSILAVLMGSTTLGGSLPTRVYFAIRHTIIGNRQSGLMPISSNRHLLLALRYDQFANVNVTMHSFIVGNGIEVVNSIQHIIEGFYGIMVSGSAIHTALIETELAGYGYEYGDIYGD